MIVATLNKSYFYQSRRLTTQSAAFFTVVLFSRIISQKNLEPLMLWAFLKEVLINGFLYWNPTRHICKAVNRVSLYYH